MKINVKIFGAQKLVDRMANKGQGVVEFSGGTVNDLLSHLLTQHGLTWADVPLLEKWEENINIFILHNDNTLKRRTTAGSASRTATGCRCTSTRGAAKRG